MEYNDRAGFKKHVRPDHVEKSKLRQRPQGQGRPSMAIRKKTNRLFFFITGYTLVFGLLAYFGYVELRRVQDAKDEKQREVVYNPLGKSFYRLPRMDLTLASFRGDMHHVRLGINLEIDQKNVIRFEDFQPRVSERIIEFLGRQDVDKIGRPAAARELRHDLLHVANEASKPVPVSDIIFREFVVR